LRNPGYGSILYAFEPAVSLRPSEPLNHPFGEFEQPLANRYRVEGELGRGGTAIVYRGTDLRLDRPVAIKILHPALTSEIGVKRFESEIHIAASLTHPNIVVLHDAGEVNDSLFYVMQYFSGESLRSRLERERTLSIADAVSIARDVASGLQHAHDHGIVHRDIKPESVILAERRAVIVDFGLARIINDAGSPRLTESGIAVGTPQYLSPEQAAAEKSIGPAADQYALGCILFEMLAGEPPFTGPTATATAMRHLRDAPPSLRTRRPETTSAIQSSVERALAKNPSDRFENVTEFSRALTDTDGLRAEHHTKDTLPQTSFIDSVKRLFMP
jgi:serine/threonine protein kinase